MEVTHRYNGELYGTVPNLSSAVWNGVRKIETISRTMIGIHDDLDVALFPMKYRVKPGRTIRFNSRLYAEYIRAKNSSMVTYSPKKLDSMVNKAIKSCRYNLFRIANAVGFESDGLLKRSISTYNIVIHTENQFTLTCFDKINSGDNDDSAWLFKLVIEGEHIGNIDVDYSNNDIKNAELYINHRSTLMNTVAILNVALSANDKDLVGKCNNLINEWYRVGRLECKNRPKITDNKCSEADRVYSATYAIKQYAMRLFMEYLATTHAFESALCAKVMADDYQTGFITELINEAIVAHNIKEREDGTWFISSMEFNDVKSRRRVTGRKYDDAYRLDMKLKQAQKISVVGNRGKRKINVNAVNEVDGALDKTIEATLEKVDNEALDITGGAANGSNVDYVMAHDEKEDIEAVTPANSDTTSVSTFTTIAFEVDGRVFKLGIPKDGIEVYQNDTKVRIFIP